MNENTKKYTYIIAFTLLGEIRHIAKYDAKLVRDYEICTSMTYPPQKLI